MLDELLDAPLGRLFAYRSAVRATDDGRDRSRSRSSASSSRRLSAVAPIGYSMASRCSLWSSSSRRRFSLIRFALISIGLRKSQKVQGSTVTAVEGGGAIATPSHSHNRFLARQCEGLDQPANAMVIRAYPQMSDLRVRFNLDSSAAL